jgi:hypothetical protein
MVKPKKRIAISKKVRFEVFKRDSFTCQYCGEMSPNVILEVDHIKPCIDGGNNRILNLVTSCFDCNRGKGKTLLSDDSMLSKQQNQLKKLADKREQIELMIKWQEELDNLDNKQVDNLSDYWGDFVYPFNATKQGKHTLLKL